LDDLRGVPAPNSNEPDPLLKGAGAGYRL